MNRLTMTGAAAVLAGTVLVGATLVSVALAATSSLDATPATSAGTANLRDADVSPVFDIAANAAAATLAISNDELAGRLAGGSSLKQIADAREVGYGSVARAVNAAVSAALDEAIRRRTLTERRAEELRSDVAAWIDAGGQPDTGWLGAPD